MGFHRGPTYNSVSEITGPSGFYKINTSLGPIVVYIDQDYDGGGWVLVLSNRGNTGGMNNLKYDDAINNYNYRTGGSGKNSANIEVTGDRAIKNSSLSNLNTFIGLKFWFELAQRETANKVTISQFVSTTNGTALNDTSSHTKRYRWGFDGWGSDYSFNNSYIVSDETGTGSPGFYNYHSKGSRGLTTYDNDQDDNSGNCATYYNNNPFWYGSCWSGNYFAGGGHAD